MGYVIYKHGRKSRWWYLSEKKDFNTQYGVIPKKKLKPGTVKLGDHEFSVIEATFSDAYHAMKRDAQIITRKDIGFIIGYCALGKDSAVVESGAGSGGATIMLARVCKKVHSFEVREDHLKVVKHNLQQLSLKNVSLKLADFYDPKAIKVKNADLVLLDVPEPWQAYDTAKKVTKSGGFIVAYTPTITQAQEFVNKLPADFLHERTIEVMDREWKIAGKAVRPGNTPIGHTAFLTFVRKV